LPVSLSQTRDLEMVFPWEDGPAPLLSNKPKEADCGHGDEPCGKPRPPLQHGVIAQQALKPFDSID